MNELKPGWKRVKFGDVVRQVKDKVDAKSCGLTRYIAGEHMDTNDLAIRRWGEITDDYLGPAFHMRFKPGHVLYGSRRTYLRKVAVADFEGITANTTFVLESKDPSILLPELLPFIMSTEDFHAHSKKQSKGSVNPYVNFSDLTWYEFALPPLDEQHGIAALLESSTGVLSSLKSLSKAVETGIEALIVDRLHLRGFKPHSGKHLWSCKVGDELFAAQSGNGTPSLLEDGSAMFLKVADFNRNPDHRKLMVSESSFNPVGNEKFRLFTKGAVVFPKRGATIFHGKVGILGKQAALDPNLMALTPNPALLRSRYLFWLLRGIGLWRLADTTTVPQLNHKHLKPVRLPVPPLNVQDAITNELDSMADALDSTSNREIRAAQMQRHLLATVLNRASK